MSSEQNEALLRQYLAAWAAGNTEHMRQMLGDECITHHLATGETREVAFETEAADIWHNSFGDVELHIEQMMATEDRVAAVWRLNSTHTAEFIGIEATGERVRVAGMEMVRIAGGKIVEVWRLSDTMSLMQQLGAV